MAPAGDCNAHAEPPLYMVAKKTSCVSLRQQTYASTRTHARPRKSPPACAEGAPATSPRQADNFSSFTVGGCEKAGDDHAAAAAKTTKKDTYTPSAVEIEFDQLVNTLELELQESSVKNMENANIGINDPDPGVVTALTTKLPETEFQGKVYKNCESDQPDTQRLMIHESEFHLVIDDITKELKIKVAHLESQLASLQVNNVRMLSVETNQNDMESLMLDFDKLCQTWTPSPSSTSPTSPSFTRPSSTLGGTSRPT